MGGLRGGLMGGSMATAASHLAAHTENGVSGSDGRLHGGTLVVVGNDCGVATWSIDQIARRTFPTTSGGTGDDTMLVLFPEISGG